MKIFGQTSNSGTHLVFGNNYQPANSYEGEQRIYSGYFSNEFEIIENLKSVVGFFKLNFFNLIILVKTKAAARYFTMKI